MKIKTKKHSIKRKILFSLTMFLIGLIISFKYLSNNVEVDIPSIYSKYLIEEILSNKNIIEKLNKDEVIIEDNNPIIYLYNTHDTEEYSSNNPFNFRPNVSLPKYIIKEELESNNINVLVEERSIKDILNKNNWKYVDSYKASRIYLEDIKNNYPSIKYFIDIHRDSLSKDKTTITIDNKDYASILFIIGLENENYNNNLLLTETISNKLNEKYPNLSKGIYKKSGIGVNGIYNQDISSNCILVEIGGIDNKTNEVLNSSIALSNILGEIINER